MNKPVIICIDDEPSVLESLKIELKRALGTECLIETAEGGEDALDLIQDLISQECDVALVLSDYIMPDIKGDEVLKQIHRMSPNTLTIMLTGQANVEAVSNAIKYARLYRYIAKPWQPEDLKLTVVEAVHSYLQDKKLAEQNLKLQQMNQELARLTHQQAQIIAERTADLEKVNRELRRLVTLDSLTQVANRRRCDEYLTQTWWQLSQDQQPLSLILADVDFFKCYNDHYGHLAGDYCLQEIAQTLHDSVANSAGLVARYGGEEFIIILPKMSLEVARELTEEIRLKVEGLKIPHACSSISDVVTASFGVASVIPQDKVSPLVLINAADAALYEAKQQGRNRIIVNVLSSSSDESDLAKL